MAARQPPKTEKIKWQFTARFRKRAFGWKGTQLASKRLKEAFSEINKQVKVNPLGAVEGAILLLEKLVPSIEQIDSSSGSMGTAVYNILGKITGLIAKTEAPFAVRKIWLERIWEVYQDDDMGYLDSLGDLWGDLCGTVVTLEAESIQLASYWADEMLAPLKTNWCQPRISGYFKGQNVCLSSLLRAQRNEEILALLSLAPYKSWDHRQYGAQALVQMGQYAQAIAYAEANQGINDSSALIDEFCESALIKQGLLEEAYQRYALTSSPKNTYIATFKAIAKRYPHKKPLEILVDLIDHSSTDKGKWFATAKSLGFLDLAVSLIKDNPCDPLTLNRAARDYLDKNPDFARQVALAAIRWFGEGYGYEVSSLDVYSAKRYALEAAEKLGCQEATRQEINHIINQPAFDSFSKKYLSR